MPQLSLYVTDENLASLRMRSKAAGVSMSKYANRLIEQDALDAGWPLGFWELFGVLETDIQIPEDAPPADDAVFELMFANES